MNLQKELKRLEQAGEPKEVVKELEKAVESRKIPPHDRLELAGICEEKGFFKPAFRILLNAAKEEPDSGELLEKLAEYHAEEGDLERAGLLLAKALNNNPQDMNLLEKLVSTYREAGLFEKANQAVDLAVDRGLDDSSARRLRRQGSLEDEKDEESDKKVLAVVPSDGDVIRFMTLFNGRENLHARQWWNRKKEKGGYSPVQEPLTPRNVQSHLLGNETFGIYPIRLDGTVSLLAFDLDIRKDCIEGARHDKQRAVRLRELLASETLRVRDELATVHLDPLMERSGYKGVHFWVFFEKPMPCSVAFKAGLSFKKIVCRTLPPELSIEHFPKQGGRTGKGFGNLIKLPLGMHKRSGRRSELLDEKGNPVSDPFMALKNAAIVNTDSFHSALSILEQRVSELPETGDEEKGKKSDKTVEGPPPEPGTAPWSDADFDICKDMAHLLKNCPVLDELKKKALEQNRLSLDEQNTLIHSLGHLPKGPLAVNHLFERCPDVGPDRYMKSPLSGNSVSCTKIKRRLPYITADVDCSCAFPFAPDRYPTPVLHLMSMNREKAKGKNDTETKQEAEKTNPAGLSAEQLARRYAALKRKENDLEEQLKRAGTDLSALLRTKPDRALSCKGGSYVLKEEDGVENISWNDEEKEEK